MPSKTLINYVNSTVGDESLVEDTVNRYEEEREMTRTLFIAMVISCLGSIQLGYNFWVINQPLALRQSFDSLNISRQSDEDETSEFIEFLLRLTIFIFPFGGFVGSLLVGPMVDNCGRKDTLLLNNFLSAMSSALTGFSSVMINYEFILFSRLFSGICSGIFSCTVPLYIGEISPVDMRGATIVTSMVFVNIGTLLALIMGQPKIMGTKNGLPILMSLTMVPAILSIFLLPFIPESPRYLLVQKNEEEKAIGALQKLRNQEDVEDEIQDLYQEDIAERGEKNMNVLKLIRFRTLRWHLLTIIILIGGHQLSGIHMAYIHLEKLIKIIAKQKIEVAGLTSVSITILGLLVLINIIDSTGRRIPLLIGYGITNILSIVLTMILELEDTISWMYYVSIVFLLIFIFGYNLGPGAMPPVLIIELFLQSARSSAIVFGASLQWFLHFLMIILTYHLQYLGPYVFLIFWPFSTIGFIYCIKVIPETQKKSFVTIKRLMALYMARKIMAKGSTKDEFKNRSRRSSRRRSSSPQKRRTSMKH